MCKSIIVNEEVNEKVCVSWRRHKSHHELCWYTTHQLFWIGTDCVDSPFHSNRNCIRKTRLNMIISSSLIGWSHPMTCISVLWLADRLLLWRQSRTDRYIHASRATTILWSCLARWHYSLNHRRSNTVRSWSSIEWTQTHSWWENVFIKTLSSISTS